MRKAGCDPLPNQAVYQIKAAPGAPLARRQRRALPWEARPGARRRHDARIQAGSHVTKTGV